MGDPNVESEYITVVEAARILRMAPRTITRWAAVGRIPHTVTVHGEQRFSRADVADMARRMGGAG